MTDLYFMSPPGRGWALRGRANFRSAEASPVDAARARREWLALARRIEQRGGRVCVLPPDDALTGLPYAAEAGHPLPPRAGGRPRFILPRMFAAHRRGERERWAPLVERLGFELIDLPETALWEGQGDVAWFDDVTLLFHGGRTNRAGLDAAASHFDGELLTLELRQPAFHGNMAVLPLGAVDRLLVCHDVIVGDGSRRLAERFGSERLIAVSEAEIRSYATNGLPVGDAWLVPAVAPARVQALVAELGLRVEPLTMTELCEKAGGASRCLVCVFPNGSRWLEVPAEYSLAYASEELDRDG